MIFVKMIMWRRFRLPEQYIEQVWQLQNPFFAGAVQLPRYIDILTFLKEGDSYGSNLGCRSVASVGSSPELALESFTVSSDPCSFGLTVSYLRSVTFGLSDRRSFDIRNYTQRQYYGE